MPSETGAQGISEEQHREAEARVSVFRYRVPADFSKKKTAVVVGKTDLIRGMVQVVKEGGESNLHYHTNADALWLVLRGKASFYGPGDVLIGEVGPDDGVIMPRNARYWFESSSEEQLEILLVQAFGNPQPEKVNTGRTDAAARTQRQIAEKAFETAD